MGVEEDTAAVEDKKEYGHARVLHLQLSNETERAALLADDYKKQNEPKKRRRREWVGIGETGRNHCRNKHALERHHPWCRASPIFFFLNNV
jgi:hypothetical protein